MSATATAERAKPANEAAPAGENRSCEVLVVGGGPAGSTVATLLAQHGFDQVTSRTDLAGIARCTGGRWAGR